MHATSHVLEKKMVRLVEIFTNQKIIASIASILILLSLSLPWVSFSILTQDLKFVNYNVTPFFLRITNPNLDEVSKIEWFYENDATIFGIITVITGFAGIFSGYKKNKRLLLLCGAVSMISVILFPSTLPGWFLKMRIDTGIFISSIGSLLLIYGGLLSEKPAKI